MHSQAEIKSQLPDHLQQFVAEQDYNARYTPRDHAVWRYVMAQLSKQLKDTAHPVYFEGLEKVGISIESIPSIDDMNVCLDRLGWKAIVVDGFIPPQAFMELQSLKILAIALDMRTIEHIEYTPAPDIIHEAAGHAPIIVDEEYSDYLSRFGEVGMKAISNQWDLNMYQAIRTLSILKEDQDTSDQALAAAEKALDDLNENPGEPSELAVLSRLHWWTVEYGLVGDVNDYRIFGAGLLSSMAESTSCLESNVKKLPLTTDAIMVPYDITSAQPHLFVTKSCRHLTQVLDEFASTMCYQQGRAGSIQIALDSGVVNTLEYSSGLQVSGKVVRLLTNVLGQEIYVGTEGPTQLACHHEQLEGHGTEYHSAGFGSPVGRICNLMKPLEDASEYELQTSGIKRGAQVVLEFLSGVVVNGQLDSVTKSEGRIILMSFSDCTVIAPNGDCLFDPSWGQYDMAVGEVVRSVYAGSADQSQFDVYPQSAPAEPNILAESDDVELELYKKVAEMRRAGCHDGLADLTDKAIVSCPSAWLLFVELLELAGGNHDVSEKLVAHLSELKQQHPHLEQLF